MSYILEALKKAQAERQLGSSPTIHAPTLHSADTAAAGGRFKKPVVLVLAGMGIAIAVLLAMVLRPSAPPAAAAPGPASAAAPAPALPATAAASPAPVAAAPARQPVETAPTPLPVPVADLPSSVANMARASAPQMQAQASTPAPVPAVAAKPAAPEEPVVNQRDLPEPIQRSIPQVAVGGYIYSKNPADRLLLIDKVLRHEGEEVAPGLTLEKLQPKEAIFSFKGYRYRVPY